MPENLLFSLEIAFCVLFKTDTMSKGFICHRFLSFKLISMLTFLKNVFLESQWLPCASGVSVFFFCFFSY